MFFSSTVSHCTLKGGLPCAPRLLGHPPPILPPPGAFSPSPAKSPQDPLGISNWRPEDLARASTASLHDNLFWVGRLLDVQRFLPVIFNSRLTFRASSKSSASMSMVLGRSFKRGRTSIRNCKVCIFNLQLISQAGRRGFDPRLPLHLFNNLQETLFSLYSKILH